MSTQATYIDPTTERTFPLDTPLWRSPDGNALMISELSGITEVEIEREERSLWRYQKALPVNIERPVTLGEGLTPLLARDTPSGKLYFKLEWFSPTGSFKDHQPAVSKQLRVLRESGLAAVRVDAQRRIYSLNADGLREVDDWMAPFRAFWEERLDSMED